MRAINKYGNGDYSVSTSIVAGQAPDQPSAPTLSISGVYVMI